MKRTAARRMPSGDQRAGPQAIAVENSVSGVIFPDPNRPSPAGFDRRRTARPRSSVQSGERPVTQDAPIA